MTTTSSAVVVGSRPGGAVGMVASYDPLTDARGGSNPRWATGKVQDFPRPG